MPSPDPPDQAPGHESDAPADVITRLRALDDDPNQWEVIVGDHVAATLPRSAVEDLELYESMPWTDELAAEIAAWQRRDVVRHVALERLGRRSYARQELIDRLEQQGHDNRDVEHVVDELAEMGWLDDRLHALSVARRIFDRSPCSRSMLIDRTMQKSIARDDAEAAADDLLADQDDRDIAQSVAQTMLKRESQTPPTKARRRIGAALARRGFDEDTINDVLDESGLGEDALE